MNGEHGVRVCLTEVRARTLSFCNQKGVRETSQRCEFENDLAQPCKSVGMRRSNTSIAASVASESVKLTSPRIMCDFRSFFASPKDIGRPVECPWSCAARLSRVDPVFAQPLTERELVAPYPLGAAVAFCQAAYTDTCTGRL